MDFQERPGPGNAGDDNLESADQPMHHRAPRRQGKFGEADFANKRNSIDGQEGAVPIAKAVADVNLVTNKAG